MTELYFLDYDVGDYEDTAEQISSSDIIYSTIDYSFDYDYYQIVLEEDVTYNIDLEGYVVGTFSALNSGFFSLQQLYDEPIAYAYDWGDSTASLSYTPTETDNYYIAVGSSDDMDLGSYKLSITSDAEPPAPIVDPFNPRLETDVDIIPGNTSGAYELKPGDRFVAAIQDANDVDYFYQDVEAGEVYVTYATSTEPNPSLSPNFNILGGGTGSEAMFVSSLLTHNIFISRSNQDTRRYVRFNGDQDEANEGDYLVGMLQAERVEDGTDIIGNVSTDAYSININEAIVGQLNPEGDIDFFSLSIPADTGVLINMQEIFHFFSRDPDLTLYTSDGEIIAQTDSYNPTMIVSSQVDQELILSVSGNTTVDLGEYALSAIQLYDSIPNDVSTSRSIDIGGANSYGTLETTNDEDWFEISLEAGKNYNIDLSGNLNASTLQEVSISIYRADGSKITDMEHADFAGWEASLNATVSALETGTYYIGVRQSDNVLNSTNAGQYSLGVSETSTPPDAILTAGDPQLTINVPAVSRFGGFHFIQVEYENVSATEDAPAIIFTDITNGLFNSADVGQASSLGTFVFTDSGSFSQNFSPSGGIFNVSQTSFSTNLADPSSSIDWQAREDSLRPTSVSDEAWDQVFSNFLSNVGDTVQDLSLALAEDAYRLGSEDGPNTSVDAVLQFELQQAGDFGSIAERLKDGSLGKGWTSIADLSLDIASDGSVSVNGLLDSMVFQSMDVSLSAQYTSSIPLAKGVDLNGNAFQGSSGQPVFERGTGVDNGYILQARNGGYSVLTPDNDRYNFDSNGMLTQIKLDNGSTVTPSFDAAGNITGFLKSDGEAFTLDYDALSGNLSSISDNENHNATFDYSADNATLVSAITDSGSSSFTYDGLNSLIQAQRDGNPAINFSYNAEGKLASYDIGGAQPETYSYDDAGAVTTTNALGEELVTQYGLNGSILSITNDLGETITFESNGFSQVIELPDGTQATFSYNAQGQPTVITDAAGNNIYHQYANGLIGDIARFTDAGGNVRNYSYDADGKMTGATWDDGTNLQFEYDSQGNLSAQINRRGEETQITRDSLGRVTNVSDSSAGDVTYTYDASGNLISATNAEGTTSISYDAANRATLIEYPNGNSLAYTYDAAGKRTSMTNQDGENTFYSYDSAGRIETISDDAGVITTYGYDAAGRLLSEINRNGTETVYEYDGAGRQTSITHKDADGNVATFYNYTYDNTGKQTSAETSDGTWDYEYDATGQLTKAEFTSTNASIDSVVLEYAYDAAGNRISTTENGTVTNYAANDLNQYTSAGDKTFTYDADGNTLSQSEAGNDYSYLYDIENRLIQVIKPDSSTIQYEYDIFGNRSALIEDGVRTEFLVDPFGFGNVVGEYDASGNKIASYTHGLGLVSKSGVDGSLAYFEADSRGSITGLTDDNGNLVNQYHYTPFGQEIFESETIMNSFEFNGSFGITEDAEDLHYVRARSYDSETGRFLQEDPLFLDGDPANLYRFNFNNPNNFVDVNGEIPIPLIIIGIASAAVSFNVGYDAAQSFKKLSQSNSLDDVGPVIGSAGFLTTLPIAGGIAVNIWADSIKNEKSLLKGVLKAAGLPSLVGVGAGLVFGSISDAEASTTVVPQSTFNSARNVGDPHYVTFDGTGYSFQAAGEFTMTRTLDNNFEIQVRQEPYQGRGDVSINTSMALRSGEDVVEIQANGEVLVNGLAVQLESGDATIIGLNGFLVREGDNFTFINENGNGVRVDIKDGEWLDVVPFLDPSTIGQVEGLLGNNDGDGTNDLVLPDGTVLEQPVPFDVLYGEFANAWRVSDEGSLFTYGEGETTATFTDLTFPHVITTLDDLDPVARADAEQIALAAGLEPGTFEFETTVLDIAVTGNTNFLPDVDILDAKPSTTDIVIQRPPVTQDDTASVDEDLSVTIDVLANDSDPENDTLTLVSAADENGGTVAIVNNQIEFSPAANFNGVTQITYQVSDGQGNTSEGIATVTVLAVNDAPDAVNDSFAVNEDTVLSGNVLSNDNDIDGDTLSVQPMSFLTASSGMVELLANGDFTYTPAPDFNGSDSFEYTVSDGNGGFDSASVNINVVPVNDDPVAQDDAFTGQEDAVLTGNVLDNDSDIDGDVLSVISETIVSAEGGTITMNADGSFEYTPASGFSGADSFDYTVIDGNGGSDIGSVSLTIETDTSDRNEITGTQERDILKGTKGEDDIYGLGGDDIIHGRKGNDLLDGGSGDDLLFGGSGDDIIFGGLGNDFVKGGKGNDIIYGGTGDNSAGGLQTHNFESSVLFPNLTEFISITDLVPPGDNALGIAKGDLSVDFATTGTITFLESGAGYNNSLGFYNIAQDGTILDTNLAFDNVKNFDAGETATITLPGAPDTDFGFFIIAEGFDANHKFKNIDLDSGELEFIFDLGGADERAAKITDSAEYISLVHTSDQGHETILKGAIYHTTERGADTNLNPDGEVHVVSGVLDQSLSTLNANTFDLRDHPDSITKNGITVNAGDPIFNNLHKGKLDWVNTKDGNGIGIKGNGGNKVWKQGEVLEVTTAQAAEILTLTIADIGKNNLDAGIDFKIYLAGHEDSPIEGEFDISTLTPVNGKIEITLDASDFGGGLITQVDVFSVKNTHLDAASFLLNNVTAEFPEEGASDDTLRIGFEDLPNLGDADYNDVVFDLTIAEQSIGDGDDILFGGQGDDIIYGEAGNDILKGQSGNDVLYGGAGDDILFGGSGDDILHGGSGDDVLYGGSGNDIIFLGEGENKAFGGKGQDSFVFQSFDAKADTIYGFETGEGGDILNLSDILSGFDPLVSDILEFVKVTEHKGNSEIQINTGSEFTTVAVIEGGVCNMTINDLIQAGNLVVGQGV